MINTAIFIFFALLDASMVGLCSYSCSGREKYREGMIFGVHVPPNVEEDETAASLMRKYKGGFRISRNLNLAAGILIPVSVGRFSPFRVGLKTPISVNLKSPMHHVCY